MLLFVYGPVWHGRVRFERLRLAVFTYFTLLSNPGAIYLIMAMPSLMLLFLTCLDNLHTSSRRAGKTVPVRLELPDPMGGNRKNIPQRLRTGIFAYTDPSNHPQCRREICQSGAFGYLQVNQSRFQVDAFVTPVP